MEISEVVPWGEPSAGSLSPIETLPPTVHELPELLRLFLERYPDLAAGDREWIGAEIRKMANPLMVVRAGSSSNPPLDSTLYTDPNTPPPVCAG